MLKDPLKFRTVGSEVAPGTIIVGDSVLKQKDSERYIEGLLLEVLGVVIEKKSKFSIPQQSLQMGFCFTKKLP